MGQSDSSYIEFIRHYPNMGFSVQFAQADVSMPVEFTVYALSVEEPIDTGSYIAKGSVNPSDDKVQPTIQFNGAKVLTENEYEAFYYLYFEYIKPVCLSFL